MPPTTSSLKTHAGGDRSVGSPGSRGNNSRGPGGGGFRASRASTAASGNSDTRNGGGRRRVPNFNFGATGDGFEPNRSLGSRNFNIRDRRRFGLDWGEDGDGEDQHNGRGGRRGRNALTTPMHVQQSSEVKKTLGTVTVILVSERLN